MMHVLLAAVLFSAVAEVDSLLRLVPPDAQMVFSLRNIVTDEHSSSLEGLLQMMVAKDWESFKQGLALYRTPGVHLIYADTGNNIAYWTLARLPLRAHNARIPFRGWTGDEEWQGVIPFEDMPHMLNPASGFISTANNAPVGSWYPYDIGGGLGDNARSLRLKELLGGVFSIVVFSGFCGLAAWLEYSNHRYMKRLRRKMCDESD